MKLREKFSIIGAGYQDAREGKPYKRAPGPEPPELPKEALPVEWQCYFDGWDSGIQDAVAQTLREVAM